MRTSTILLSALSLAGLGLSAPREKRSQPRPLIEEVPLEPAMHVDGLIKDPKIIKLTKEHLATFASTSGNVTKLESGFKQAAARRGAALTDGRHINDRTDYPYGAVGRLYITDGHSAWVCTASLVGPRLISTASHCVFDMPAGTSWTFSPDYFNGDRYQTSQVNTIVAENWSDLHDCTWKNDWAVMVLNDPIGNDRGWFGAMVYDDTLRWQHIYYTAGYPGDMGGTQEQVSQENIDALQVECDNYSGAVDFEVYAAGGQSGSPIWLQGLGIPDMYQAAILSGSTSEYSVAAWGPDWVNTINSLRQQYP